MHGVFALLLALEERERTGEGQLVEVPLVEPAINIAAEQVIEWSAYGAFLASQGNRGPCAAPQGVYPCRERESWLALAVATDEHWSALCALLGDPEWARDPELANEAGRRAAHDAIDTQLEAWLADQSAADAAERLVAGGVPAQHVQNAHFVSPHPQLEHREFFQRMEHSAAGKLRYPGLPMSFSGLPRDLHPMPPPTLGQDNDAVLRDTLGLSEDEIAALREAQVIGERPSFM
jgi:crotonobetainyl-CoA:carnitine CoA-transferase CaiB-like acyl-CoA transferase